MDEIIAACMTYEESSLEIEQLSSFDSTAWILGRSFSTTEEIENLTNDVQSKIWCTYRRDFEQIGESGYTTDKGWGCMVRCGQMIIAEAMIRHHLGRQWQWTEETEDKTYLQILEQFEDHQQALYSLHNITLNGEKDNKQIGDWYGPNTIAQVLKKVAVEDTWSNFCINVALDNILILDEIRSTCQTNNSWKPLILFIPLRLGITDMNPIYVDALKKCMVMPQSLGLIGGRPHHALYFIGYVGSQIIYLDPHTTQECGKLNQKTTDTEKALDKSYHCNLVQHMNFLDIDPSISLCFVCSTEKEFDDLCNRLRHDLVDSESTSLIELVATRPHYMMDDNEGLEAASLDDHQYHSEDDEEFEVLEELKN